MWDRLLVDCRIATLEGGAMGVVDNGAVGIADGKIVRVGKRTELAGFRAKEVVALGGAWVTPGLIDCHTHLVYGGDRAGEFEQRLAGVSYEEIAPPAAAFCRPYGRRGKPARTSSSRPPVRGLPPSWQKA